MRTSHEWNGPRANGSWLLFLLAVAGVSLSTAVAEEPIRAKYRQPVREHATLTGHSGRVNTVAFSPDGKTLASGSGDSCGQESGEVLLWDTSTGMQKPRLQGTMQSVLSLAFSPDGTTLVTGEVTPQNDGEVRLWDLATRKPARTLAGHIGGVCDIAYAPGGKTLTSAGRGYYGAFSRAGNLKQWEVTTGKLMATGTRRRSTSLALSADGRMLALGSQDSSLLEVREVLSGKVRAELEGHKGFIASVAFSQDGTMLVSGGGERHTTETPTRWSGEVIVWDVRARKKRRSLAGLQGIVWSVAISPDGSLIATGGGRPGNAELRLWDARSGRELASLPGHTDWVKGVVFSPDGKTLASASQDKAVKLWDLSPPLAK